MRFSSADFLAFSCSAPRAADSALVTFSFLAAAILRFLFSTCRFATLVAASLFCATSSFLWSALTRCRIRLTCLRHASCLAAVASVCAFLLALSLAMCTSLHATWPSLHGLPDDAYAVACGGGTDSGTLEEEYALALAMVWRSMAFRRLRATRFLFSLSCALFSRILI